MKLTPFLLLSIILAGVSPLKHAKGEDYICNDICMHLKSETLSGVLCAVWFHIPNERLSSNSKQAKAVAYSNKLKAVGRL
jgi:hypothetical protein